MPRPAVAVRAAVLAGAIAMLAGPGAGPGRPARAAGVTGPAGFAAAPADSLVARDSLARSALPAAVWAARDSIAARFAGHRHVTVARSSGRFEDPLGRRLITTCRLTIVGSFATTPRPRDAGSLIEAYLARTRWKPDEECSADGPDGTMRGMRRDGVRCLVQGRWDGGDATDTTYVPRPEYEVIVDCLVDRVDICPP